MKSLTSSTRSSVSKRSVFATWPLLVLPVLVHAQPNEAQAAPKTQRTTALAPANQAWPGKRVALVLPLRTGTAWNANPEFTQMFLPQAQSALREALSRTGKFSVLEVRRFNPVLMRAVQDGAATTDDLNTLLDQPTVPNAGVFLTKTSFNRAPLQSFSTSATIGSFVLESVEQVETGLRLKVTGRMYEPGATTAMRALSAIVTVPYNFASGSARTPGLVAANVGFDRVLQEFTRYPTERELPIVPVLSAVAVAPVASPVVSTEVSSTQTEVSTTTSSTVVLPGTPIAGASTRPLTPDGRATLPLSTTTTTTTTSTTVVSPLTINSTPSMPGLPAGITIEVETPPAEVFPVAAPVGDGGGDGTESAEGTSEAVVDDTVATDDTATEDTATSEESAMTEDTSSTETTGDSTDTSSDTGSDPVPDADSSNDSSDNVSEGGSTGSDETSGDSGDSVIEDISDEITEVMPAEESTSVTTSVSPRIRDRAPGELPSFER